MKQLCKLTEEGIERLLAALKAGKTMGDARKSAGFTLTQFYDWIKKAKAGRGGLYAVLHSRLNEALGGISAASRSSRQYSLDEHFFSNVDSESKAYWLGFITADGWVSRGHELGIKLQRRDRDHLGKFLAAVKSDAAVQDQEPTTSRYVNRVGAEVTIQGGLSSRVVVCSKKLVADLLALGVDSSKSKSALPWDGPPSLLPAYYRGLVDGDGTIHYSQNRINNSYWCVGLYGTAAIVEGFRQFLKSHGVSPPKMFKKIGCWNATLQGTRSSQKAMRTLYDGATVYLDRKYEQVQECWAVQTLRDWKEWTLDEFAELKSKLPSWAAVAAHLGTTRSNLVHIRRRAASRL